MTRALRPQLAYDTIATEYYDTRHVTSRNFDSATRAGAALVVKYLPTDGRVIDIGSGRGRAHEFLGIHPSRLHQIDLSAAMLRLSPRELSVERVRANAAYLPFVSESFSAAVSFLYDPYNSSEFYEQVHRVLAVGGVFIGTLPHEEWGSQLRAMRGYPKNRARFQLRSGHFVDCRSVLQGTPEIQEAVSRAGLRVIDAFDLCLPREVKVVSPDILDPARALGVNAYAIPIVHMTVAYRP